MPTIYLSPSLQPLNKYINGSDEQTVMNQVADAMEPYLRACGIRFTRNHIGMTLGQAIQQSNEGYYDLHLALHSNAAPESLAGKLRGTDVYYYAYSTPGKRAAEILAENFKKISPTPHKVKALPTTKLVELSKTNAPAVLMEIAYNDNQEDADWIKGNIQKIAANIVEGLCIYFGIPFIADPPAAPKRHGGDPIHAAEYPQTSFNPGADHYPGTEGGDGNGIGQVAGLVCGRGAGNHWLRGGAVYSDITNCKLSGYLLRTP